MSVRELDANVSRALKVAEEGEDILLPRNGQPSLRITRRDVDLVQEKRATACC